jgi:hypothetical protein
MPQLPVKALRVRLPALGITALFHLVAIFLLLQAIPQQSAPAAPKAEPVVVLLPELPAAPKAPRRVQHGSNAITSYFNPQLFTPQALQRQPGLQGLGLVLAACAPENYDKASEEVRSACTRIGMIVAADTGHFGVTTDFNNGKRWERELMIKQTPLLLPCMSPGANVLYTLFCIADVLTDGYDPDKMPHYEK